MKYRLKSPNSYKRIDATLLSDPISVDDYILSQKDITEYQVNKLRYEKPDIRKWIALVTYEANNSYNATLRDKFVCEAVTTNGKPPAGGASETVKELMMKVNGKTGLELQTEAVVKQYQEGQSAN